MVMYTVPLVAALGFLVGAYLGFRFLARLDLAKSKTPRLKLAKRLLDFELEIREIKRMEKKVRKARRRKKK